MKFTSSPKALAIAGCLTVAAVTSLLIFTSSSNAANDVQATKVSVPGEASGVLQTSAGLYEFTPRSCAIYIEDGVPDIEIEGPGTAPDGEKFYFELSSTGNWVTINLGVDGPFKSSDRKIQGGQGLSKAFTLELADNVISVAELVLIDDQGQQVDSNASLRIDCNS